VLGGTGERGVVPLVQDLGRGEGGKKKKLQRKRLCEVFKVFKEQTADSRQ
jgi:hypothetical protein